MIQAETFNLTDFEEFDCESIFIPVDCIYYCDNHYNTSDYKDAVAHGYGFGRSTAFGYERRRDLVDYSSLPVAEKFHFMLVPDSSCSKWLKLIFMDGDRYILFHPAEDIRTYLAKEGQFFCSPEKTVYFLGPYTEFEIFCNGEYVVVLDYSDIGSSRACGFRIPVKIFMDEAKQVIDCLQKE